MAKKPGRIRRAWQALRGKDEGTRMYSGARMSRLSGEFFSTNTSADTELVSSLTQLRANSRRLCRDVSYARRARTLVVNNIIGQGIGMQAQVHTSRGQLNARINDEIETVWYHWTRADSCHTGGRLDFSSFERALIGQLFEAGEVFVRKHYRPFGQSRIPYALELIEAERIADDLVYPGFTVTPGNQYRMGVELDSFHRPVAYYLRTRHPGEIRFSIGETPDSPERVPANQIIHLASGERWPQTRGEPWLSSVIKTLRDANGYVEAEITRARVQASQPWTIETPENANSFGEEMDDGTVEMVVEAGIAKRLNPGEKMNAPSINSPNTAIEPFLRYLLRDIAAGCGPSYESLSRDYSQSNFSSSRLALLDDRDLWRVFQSWFICSFREPVHSEWMQQAVMAGAFSTFTVTQWALNREKFEAIRFRPRGWGWVDPTKEVAAFKEAIKAGLATQADVLASSGLDIEEVIEQRQKEVEMANAAGLTFDVNVSAAEAEPSPPPDPPPDEDDDDEPSDEDDEPADRRVLNFGSQR